MDKVQMQYNSDASVVDPRMEDLKNFIESKTTPIVLKDGGNNDLLVILLTYICFKLYHC